MNLKSLGAWAVALGAALLSLSAQASVVTMTYSGDVTVQGVAYTYTGSFSWDSTEAGKAFNSTRYVYSVSSGSLTLKDTSSGSSSAYNLDLTKSTITLDVNGTGQESYFMAYLNTASSVAGLISISIYDYAGGSDTMLSTSKSLPTNGDWLSAADGSNLYVVNNSNGNQNVYPSSNVKFSTSVAEEAPTSVPEPGSLLLASLAGLALTATRRRKTQTA